MLINPIKEFISAVFLNKESVIAISLNILAAIIFWLFFALLPEHRRRNKLRPKLELGIYQVYSSLFSLFDLIMRFDSRSPSSFQKQIWGKRLRPEDIEIGLQNKCLNETFLYDKIVNRCLIAIGRELFEKAQRIDQLIERVFAFSAQLTTQEILCLEKIRGRLEIYSPEHFDRPAAIRIGDKQYMPSNPSLSYMATNFAQLYQLFSQLQDIVLKNNYEDRDVLLNKVQSYYEMGQYRRCRRSIRLGQAKYADDKRWLEFYLFLCEHKGGYKVQARRKLENLLETKPDLVSSRSFLLVAVYDISIREVIESCYSKAEIDNFDSVIQAENEGHRAFIEEAVRLKEYYAQKAARH